MKKEKTSTKSSRNVHLLLAAYSGYKMIKSRSYLRPAFEFLSMEKKYLSRKKKKRERPGKNIRIPDANGLSRWRWPVWGSSL